ncbi:putative uncharacterized protein [Firmicutes bacterium CAG:882]|nr:putative uncharacterized protein [Firmicutes bacterium CAG:882]
MDNQAGELRIEGNNYFVKDKKDFHEYASILPEDKTDSFEFAFGMSYAKTGEHRDYRSGGTLHRTMGQIFINTFQGKMAEFALYRYLKNHNIDVEKPDIDQYELGKWDTYDICCQEKLISVKSTKYYGNLLLLETKDWDENGEYKPNISETTSRYDYTVLVRFKPDGDSLMKQQSLLYQEEREIPDNIRSILIENIFNQDWKYDFPGFIYNSELVRTIREHKIIPQNAMLNGKTKMDAENYYFQTGNMHGMMEMYTKPTKQQYDERAAQMLWRKCPLCGNRLTLKHGKVWFWACKGYRNNPQCTFRESLDGRRF